MAQLTSAQRTTVLAAVTAVDAAVTASRPDPDVQQYVVAAQRNLQALADLFHARQVSDPSVKGKR